MQNIQTSNFNNIVTELKSMNLGDLVKEYNYSNILQSIFNISTDDIESYKHQFCDQI